MIWLIKNWRLVAGVGLIAILAMTHAAAYYKGHTAAEIECAKKNEEALQNAVIKNREVKKKVMSLSDSDLRSHYCEWVRDNKEKCLRADIPVSE